MPRTTKNIQKTDRLLKRWRIAMQFCLLAVEEIEDLGTDAAAIPEPVVIELENLMRDLRIMRGANPN